MQVWGAHQNLHWGRKSPAPTPAGLAADCHSKVSGPSPAALSWRWEDPSLLSSSCGIWDTSLHVKGQL